MKKHPDFQPWCFCHCPIRQQRTATMRPVILCATGAWLSQASTEYTWPSPHDELEDILSLQSGLYARNFVAGSSDMAYNVTTP